MGKVCDAPYAVGPWIRVSPIICFLDMLSIICRLVYYSISKRSARAASTLIMTQRYAYNHKNAESALADFRYDAPFHWAIFLLSILQIVKLFAVQGLVWTRLWASMYLASFMVVELFVFLSRRWLPVNWPPTCLPAKVGDIPRPTGSRSLPYISIAASIIFVLYFVMQAVTSALEYYGRKFSALDCGMVLLTCGGVAFIPLSYYPHTIQKNRGGVSGASISLPGSLRNLNLALSRVFFCSNVMAAVLYYAFSYDPQGTYKPAWIDRLD
jgi:hypothetical protein